MTIPRSNCSWEIGVNLALNYKELVVTRCHFSFETKNQAPLF